jgi:hypothetical protein
MRHAQATLVVHRVKHVNWIAGVISVQINARPMLTALAHRKIFVER